MRILGPWRDLLAWAWLPDDNRVVKRGESQIIGPRPGVPTVTLALSVLLCIGAMTDGASAAVVARSLQGHATTAEQRETMAALLSNLNDAARKLCRVQTGQLAVFVSKAEQDFACFTPTALRPYAPRTLGDARPPLAAHLLNLPPPALSF